MKNLDIKNISNIFKALSEPLRLRIVRLLVNVKGGLCVCEIVDALQETQYNVSRHLSVLKDIGLVRDERNGIWVNYSLFIPSNKFEQKFLDAIKFISNKDEVDFIRLKERLKLRIKGKCVVGYQIKKEDKKNG